jgi:alkanesulfonate monooxygenase SsuD/methylene tetrahydromethanopterin reductase-like flavin-dependent oxidoreductase (luciferase family)
VRDLELTDEQADRLLGAGLDAHVDEMLTYTAVGTPGEAQTYLYGFLQHTQADELMVAHQAPAIEARLRSVALLGEAMLHVPAT